MPATRILLLLLILGGLILFALQNWSPVLPLVILGLQTQALPLAFWMLGAIAAGALTTLVIAGLFNLAGLSSSGRRSRSANRAAANQAAANNTSTRNNDWNFGWTGSQGTPPPAEPSTARYSNTSRSTADDWESSSQQSQEWEDWSGYQEPAREPVDRMPNIKTPVRDAEDQEWSDWDGFEEVPDSGDRASRSAPPQDTPPPRTNYEIPQEPVNRSQTGSVYSYSYRRSEEPKRRPEDMGTDKSETIYDADFRVIRPPYRPDPEDDPTLGQPERIDPDFDESSFGPSDKVDPDAADDDWDFDDDWDDRPQNKDW